MISMKRSATPGGMRLRALREYCHQTQMAVELAASLGIGYLQRVESGKVQQPERETLERILAVLNARYSDQREILELFGYVVAVPLPTEDEIAWAVSIYQTELRRALFPMYLLDCSHRLLVWNDFVPLLFSLDPRRLAERPSMLRVIFDPGYGVTQRIANPQAFFTAQIRALRYEMRLFGQEDWHAALLEQMHRHPIFAAYWTQAEVESVVHVAGRPLTPLEIAVPGADVLQFRLISESFAQDHRFRVLYCLPAETRAFQQCLIWQRLTAIDNTPSGD